ncbi:hypothetical protein [Psychrobacter sp. H8-1]|uniref:hypothetical protein n=1 Tax=Psychrobacter sp. H8-1 TaxID=2774129 RepID=UPI0019191FE4|nr:hypothetical protein [Psychrobacter sp. H8-1]
MNNFKKLATLLLVTPLLAACSNAPADSIVEDLIRGQYEQAHSMMANDHGNVAMPTLENVDGVKCRSEDGEDSYRCIADITQSIDGNSETKTVNFLVYKYNDEWALGS